MRQHQLLLHAALSLCAGLLLSATSAAQSDAEIALQKARAAYAAGEFAPARDLLLRAAQTAPANADIFLLLGRAHYALGELEQAAAAWRRTLELAPAQAYARRMLAALSGHAARTRELLALVAALLDEGRVEAARTALAELRSRPLGGAARAGMLQLEAALELAEAQPGAALEHLEELRVRHPDLASSAPVLLLEARVRLALGAGSEAAGRAAALLQRLLREHPQAAEAASARLELIRHTPGPHSDEVRELAAWLSEHRDLPRAAERRRILEALVELRTAAALAGLENRARAGRLEGGPLPPSLAAVLAALAALRDEFPGGSTWKRQVEVAAQVAALAAHESPPPTADRPAICRAWALEIALGALAAPSGPGPRAAAIALISSLVDAAAKLEGEQPRGIAARIQARLVAALPAEDPARPAAVRRWIELLCARSAHTFSENLRAGRATANGEISELQKQILALAGELIGEQPSRAAEVLGSLADYLVPWMQPGLEPVIEEARTLLAARLSPPWQGELDLALGSRWCDQIEARDQRLVGADLAVPKRLDPRLQEVLERCYRLEEGLLPRSPLLGRVHALRERIIAHYRRLGLEDVAAQAIAVRSGAPVGTADEHAELLLGELLLLRARRALKQTLSQRGGRAQLALDGPFDVALQAALDFIAEHPTSAAVGVALERVFALGALFEQHRCYQLAIELYERVERFAAEIPVLATAKPGSSTAAERAALAGAAARRGAAAWAHRQRKTAPGVASTTPAAGLEKGCAAAIAAYRKLIERYPASPLVARAAAAILEIAGEHAGRGEWDAAIAIYAGLIAAPLPLRQPARPEFSRAVCILGKVLPDHAREVLGLLNPDPHRKPAGERASAAEITASKAPRPADAPSSASARAAPPEPASREVALFEAIRRQRATQAQRIARLGAGTFQLGQDAGKQAQGDSAAAAALSPAELTRRQSLFEQAFSAFQDVREHNRGAPLAAQARGEILVMIASWREVGEWRHAADLARLFLEGNPRDSELPALGLAIARDELAWAVRGRQPAASRQATLAETGKRFEKAREEYAQVLAAFPKEVAIARSARWENALSFLAQARKSAKLAPRVARGRYVRAARELLALARRHPGDPRAANIAKTLWDIAAELSARGYHAEAITVWNELRRARPTSALAQQAARRCAQTWQTPLGRPLRALETYLELDGRSAGGDKPSRDAILQMAVQLEGAKRWVESLHVLETFVDSFPAHPEAGQALTLIGTVHQANEAWGDAIAAYRRVLREYGQGQWARSARWSIATCRINLSQWAAANRAYRDYMAAFPKDKRLEEARRRMVILKDLARYQRLVDEKGQRKAFDAQYQIGTIVQQRLANPIKAILEYRKVAKHWPASHLADDALFEIGKIYLQLGEGASAREALVAVARGYPSSPLADDALFLVGKSYEQEADGLASVTRGQSIASANDSAQRQAYHIALGNRREQRQRGRDRILELKRSGRLAEADEEIATFAGKNFAFDNANVRLFANWAEQRAEVLSAAQLADRQDKINAALRHAVENYRLAAAVAAGDKADQALLRMASIQDERLHDAEAAMRTWLEIARQYAGTAVAENASWRIARYHEEHGQHAEAIKALQDFLRNYRRSEQAGQAQFSIAENHEHLGQWVEAMDAYTKYITNHPDGPLRERAREQIGWIKTYRL